MIEPPEIRTFTTSGGTAKLEVWSGSVIVGRFVQRPLAEAFASGFEEAMNLMNEELRKQPPGGSP
jgi:hypothetical protein